MDKTSLVLSSLLCLGFVILLAPSIIAMNRGKVLRNIAAWLCIFMVLGLVYQNFGPGRNALELPGVAKDASSAEKDQGYFPPKED